MKFPIPLTQLSNTCNLPNSFFCVQSSPKPHIFKSNRLMQTFYNGQTHLKNLRANAAKCLKCN